MYFDLLHNVKVIFVISFLPSQNRFYGMLMELAFSFSMKLERLFWFSIIFSLNLFSLIMKM